jgi:hypothetical protein
MTAAHNVKLQAVSARAALGGVEGSVLDVFGGEYTFDNRTIKLQTNRGQDRGASIRYGKNLTDVKANESTENAYNALFPYAVSGDALVTVPGKIISAGGVDGGPPRVMLMDFSREFEQGAEITSEALLTVAQSYLAARDITRPNINISALFAHLRQSAAYGDMEALERVALCDTVHVLHSGLGVDIKTKVIKTVYNTLSERYSAIELGSARANFADTLIKQEKELDKIRDEIKNTDTSAIMDAINSAIEDATNAITGASGGKVILNPSLNPQEILILQDGNSSIETAQNLWRFNSGGLGFSSNGYSGPYSLALTADGKINASAITTGTLTANIIKAGMFSDTAGKNSWNLETGALMTDSMTATNVTIVGGVINIQSAPFWTKIAAGIIEQGYNSNSAGFLQAVPASGSGITYGNMQGLFFNAASADGLLLGYKSGAANTAGIDIRQASVNLFAEGVRRVQINASLTDFYSSGVQISSDGRVNGHVITTSVGVINNLYANAIRSYTGTYPDQSALGSTLNLVSPNIYMLGAATFSSTATMSGLTSANGGLVAGVYSTSAGAVPGGGSYFTYATVPNVIFNGNNVGAVPGLCFAGASGDRTYLWVNYDFAGGPALFVVNSTGGAGKRIITLY